ncbi:MAG: hypothetical protein ACTSUE_23115 [Promethearchaeota archaeon]
MKKRISKGTLISADKLGIINIPDDILYELKEKSDNFLILFIPQEKSTNIMIIPHGKNQIIKILVHLTTFSPNTIRAIADIIYDLNLHTIHTSGMCTHDHECCYEAYIEHKDDMDLKFIREQFMKVEGSVAVDLVKLTLNG